MIFIRARLQIRSNVYIGISRKIFSE